MNKNENEIIITEEESKICNICNKKYTSTRKMIWHVKKEHQLDFEHYILKVYYNDIRPTCLKTGNPLSFKANKLGPWFHNFSKNNFPRKPHTEKSKQKIKLGCEKTSMEKYGVKNVFETDWCKEKIKNSMVEKYGVNNIMKTNEMRNLFSTFIKSNDTLNKTNETNLEKYGFIRFTCTDENKLKLRTYNYNKFYKNNWQQYIKDLNQIQIECLGDINNINNFQKLKFKCNICSFEWEDTLLKPFCKSCEEKFQNARSIEESSLMKWLKETVPNISFTSNKRFNINEKIYEADICYEKEKIIIELNGLYWHSEKAGKDKNYHINKLIALESLGYKVIQIFEDEWLFKTNIVKNKILHILGYNNLPKIYARKCTIKKINNNISNPFLELTHIQGSINASFCYGAYYNDKLVSVMTFSPLRLNMGNRIKKDGEFEMIRFSTSNEYRVIGIAGKLLSSFIKEKMPIKIYSYADKRYTNKNNNVYEKNGFKPMGDTQPNYWYVKKYKREYRFNFTKQKLVKMGYDNTKTEKEIMKESGYDRIWDCGHLKYEMLFS